MGLFFTDTFFNTLCNDDAVSHVFWRTRGFEKGQIFFVRFILDGWLDELPRVDNRISFTQQFPSVLARCGMLPVYEVVSLMLRRIDDGTALKYYDPNVWSGGWKDFQSGPRTWAVDMVFRCQEDKTAYIDYECIQEQLSQIAAEVFRSSLPSVRFVGIIRYDPEKELDTVQLTNRYHLTFGFWRNVLGFYQYKPAEQEGGTVAPQQINYPAAWNRQLSEGLFGQDGLGLLNGQVLAWPTALAPTAPPSALPRLRAATC